MNDDAENRVEVPIGHRVFVADVRPRFVGENVRFRGEQLGFFTETSTLDDGRLKRKDIVYGLYKCPDGYRVVRQETDYRRRRERARWTAQEAVTSLLPVVEGEDADRNEQEAVPVYGTFTEEEARRIFPKLFSAVGLANVRELD